MREIAEARTDGAIFTLQSSPCQMCPSGLFHFKVRPVFGLNPTVRQNYARQEITIDHPLGQTGQCPVTVPLATKAMSDF